MEKYLPRVRGYGVAVVIDRWVFWARQMEKCLQREGIWSVFKEPEVRESCYQGP